MPSVITLDEDELKRINALYAVYDAAKSSKDSVYSDKYLTKYSGFEPTEQSFYHIFDVESFVDQCYDAALMKGNHDVSRKAGNLKIAIRNHDMLSLLNSTEKAYCSKNFVKGGGSSKKRASTHRRLKSRTAVASAARRRNNRRRRTARK